MISVKNDLFVEQPNQCEYEAKQKASFKIQMCFFASLPAEISTQG